MDRTITLTRKLFTMLLSVIVYKHKLNPGQWLGTAVVFAGISVEAYVKRRGSCNFHSSVSPANTRTDALRHLPSVLLELDGLAVYRGPREESNSGEGKGQTKITVIILEHWIHRVR